MQWLEKQQFWNTFESQYRPQKRFLDLGGYIVCSPERFFSLSTICAASTPVDEGDFPGPVHRLYAEIGGNLVLVTLFEHENPFVNLEHELTPEVRETVLNAFSALGFSVVQLNKT